VGWAREWDFIIRGVPLCVGGNDERENGSGWEWITSLSLV